MAGKSGDSDYRICEFLQYGPYKEEISQSWTTKIIQNEDEGDIQIGGQYQMEWSGSRNKGRTCIPLHCLKSFTPWRKQEVILVFLFTSPCPEQSKLPVSEDLQDSKCLTIANQLDYTAICCTWKLYSAVLQHRPWMYVTQNVGYFEHFDRISG